MHIQILQIPQLKMKIIMGNRIEYLPGDTADGFNNAPCFHSATGDTW